MIGGDRRDAGVVRGLRAPAPIARPFPLGEREPPAGRVQVREHRRLLAPHGLGRGAGGVDPREPAPRGEDLPQERPAPLPRLLERADRIPRAPRGEPAAHPLLLHGHREGLVEGGVVAHVRDLVREFVEDEPGELGVRPLHDPARQGVVEPAERRVGGHPAHVDVLPPGPQPLGEAQRLGLLEVAPIGHAARHGEAPGPGRQGKLRGGHDGPGDVAPAEVGVRAVAAVVGQAEGPAREVPRRRRILEPVAEPLRGRRVGDEPPDGLACGQEGPVPGDRARVVGELRAAGGEEAEQGHACGPAPPADAAALPT